MNINAAFPSKYLKAGADVPEDGVTFVMDHVNMEDVDGKGTMKPVLHFTDTKKGLVLNVTNSKRIQQITNTQDTDLWAGQSITLYESETEFGGETVPCIRIKAKKSTKAAAEIEEPAWVK